MNRRTKIILCIVSAVLALGIAVYPLASNFCSEKYRSLVETKYTKAVEKLDDTEIIAAKGSAQAYNATLSTVTDNAYSREALAQATESYDELLNIRGDGIMGYVEIPKISVDLPIYHGTDESSLNRGTGHLLGSSLPIGGKGCHCVITGHSGLAGQKMFSDLENLEIGDVFYIHVLDESLAYMILDINKVLPEDTSKLTVDPSRDSVTLVTCTPYSVNTHRLLVRGERVEYTTAETLREQKAENQSTETASAWKEQYLRGVVGSLIIIAGAAVGVWLFFTLKKLECEEQEERAVRLNTNWHTSKKKSVSENDIHWIKLTEKPRKRGKHEATSKP